MEKAKSRYLRIWALSPRNVREILEEVVKGENVKVVEFNLRIGLVAELEDFRRQVALNQDGHKFDETETIMAIVATRLTCLKEKWRKFAFK